MAVLAALLSVLSIGASPAPAQAAAPAAVAADPWVSARSGGTVRFWDFTLDGEGAAAARWWVHSRAECGDAFCTVQRLDDRYRVFSLSRCDTFDLHNFWGLFDSHNHGTLTVEFLDRWDGEIGWYTGGMRDTVDWGPVWAVRTCNR
ncbi:hypothetical protein ACH4UV_32770 [Streptomyces sp. NPDC020802]|uniref:hypothetical protein n=1 Tax=Streptomyces sp. NPDC020802 TaxID=3365094 RepID=UPI0037A6A903